MSTTPMDVVVRFNKLAKSLSPSVKLRILQAVPAYLQRAGFESTALGMNRVAVEVLRSHFPSYSAPQLHALALYLSCRAAISSSQAAKLDSMNDMDPGFGRKLQALMEQNQKFLETLSRILKGSESTSEAITQNLK